MRSAIIAALVTSVLAANEAYPVPSSGGVDACAAACTAAHDKCVTAPGANLSFCASEYANCLGYSPYQDGSLVTPTACASGTATASATATATATASATAAPVTTTTAAAAAPSADACASACTAAHDKCVTSPGANLSFCASEYANCLGYNPYQDGSAAVPTACSASASASATAPPAPPSTGTAAPLPPKNGTAPPPVVINGAGSVRPVDVLALLAIGAVALI